MVVLNAVWYAPFAFGKIWLQYHHKLNKNLPEPRFSIAFSLCCQIITLCVLSALHNGLDVTRFSDGVFLGFILGIGLIGPFTAGNAIYFGLPLRLWALDFSHHLLVLALASGVLASFR